MKKIIFRAFLRPLLFAISSLFFSRKYLKGKYFDMNLFEWKKVFLSILTQKILGYNRKAKWSVSPFISIDDPDNIIFHPDDMHNFWHFGCYYSNTNKGVIEIGEGTWIAPNVGIITTNHSKEDLDKHNPPGNVILGKKCWIGINSTILSGVVLGDNTVVGTESVVTKNFEEGNCVIAENPAKKIK